MLKYFIYIIILIICVFLLSVALWCLKQKRHGLCPICTLKQFFRKSKLTMKIPEEFYSGGNDKTPPMGWSSWNTFRTDIDEKLIMETAKAVVDTGLADVGYKYINLDDCWQSSLRDENGKLQSDLSRFPGGIASLAANVNKMGLKLGIYSSNGKFTCEDLPGSLGNEKADAGTFAEWGIDYLKYDYCHEVKIPSAAPHVEKIEIYSDDGTIELVAENAVLSEMARLYDDKKLKTGKYISFLGQGKGSATFEFEYNGPENAVFTLCVKKSGNYEKYIVIKVNDDHYEMFIPSTNIWSRSGRYQIKIGLKQGVNKIKIFNPVCTRADSTYIQYKRMGEELKKASHGRITYSICEHGKNEPAKWAWNAGNLWRTTPDIIPNWHWIYMIYNKTLRSATYCGAGHWNDPDMLEVGNGNLTYEENRSHFSLWCMLSAPLILGNDIRKLVGNDDKNLLSVIGNKEMVAIDQDKLNKQCIRYKRTPAFDFLYKELSGNRYAVCILNKSSLRKKAVFNTDELPGKHASGGVVYREIWSRKEYKNDGFGVELLPHGCAVFVAVNK